MKFLVWFSVIVLLAACSKKADPVPAPPVVPSHPEMQYTDLQDREVTKDQVQIIDINGDGANDFLFATMLIGDPLENVDKLRFSAYSSISSSVFTSEHNSSPLLNKGDKITSQNESPFEWFVVAQVVLAEKITGVTPPSFWRGDWKDATHRFLALQVSVNARTYNGWVEISIDQAHNRFILHRAGVSKEAGRDVKAGL